MPGAIYVNTESSAMTDKERVLSITTYEEFDRQRDMLKGIKFDKEMIKHISELFGEGSMEPEVFRWVKPNGERGWR